MQITVKCKNISHTWDHHVIQMPEGATLSDVLNNLVQIDVTGGLTYMQMVEGNIFLRNNYLISPEAEVFDGDRVMVFPTMTGG